MFENVNPQSYYEHLEQALKGTETTCLTTHINPDGDGLCTCLALKRILQNMGYRADVVIDEGGLDRYEFLDIGKNAAVFNENMSYELVMVIDLHDNRRLGERVKLLSKAKQIFVLDHHEVENDLIACNHAWIDPAAVCTGWMIYSLFKQQIDALPSGDKLYVGNCLYTTLLNDTNNFTNSNTGSNAFELAKAVTQYGVKPASIYKLFMISRSASELKLLGQVLSTIELHGNGRILFMHSTLEMLRENNLSSEATSNLIRWAQDVKDADTAVYFKEERPGNYRISLRSQVRDVHSIAIKNGGGGHLRASGCFMQGCLADVKQRVLEEINQAPLLD